MNCYVNAFGMSLARSLNMGLMAGSGVISTSASGIITNSCYSHSFDVNICKRLRNKRASLPSCISSQLSVRKTPPLRSCLLPSTLYSCSSSWSSFTGCAGLGFQTLKVTIGDRGRLVHDLRKCISDGLGVRCMAGKSPSNLEDLILAKNSVNAVVVYSKTWCPFCDQVKELFRELGVQYLAIELDELADELELQEALKVITNQRSVPNVFIGGKHIGGCDDTMALHMQGRLIPLLTLAGAKFS